MSKRINRSNGRIHPLNLVHWDKLQHLADCDKSSVSAYVDKVTEERYRNIDVNISLRPLQEQLQKVRDQITFLQGEEDNIIEQISEARLKEEKTRAVREVEEKELKKKKDDFVQILVNIYKRDGYDSAKCMSANHANFLQNRWTAVELLAEAMQHIEQTHTPNGD